MPILMGADRLEVAALARWATHGLTGFFLWPRREQRTPSGKNCHRASKGHRRGPLEEQPPRRNSNWRNNLRFDMVTHTYSRAKTLDRHRNT
jgi:hypothetical protein